MNTLGAVFARRSYRGSYTDDPVPRENLQKILEAGLAAPSGCNMQSTSLIAVDDPVLLEKLREEMKIPIGESAPAMICVLTQEIPAKENKIYSKQDYSAAIENMLLAIVELGYASCWVEGRVTGASRICDRMARILGVPEEYQLVCYLPVGVAAEPCKEPEKKPFSDRAWFNGFRKEE